MGWEVIGHMGLDEAGLDEVGRHGMRCERVWEGRAGLERE